MFGSERSASRLGTLAAGSITSPSPGRPGPPSAALGSALRSGVISPAHGLGRWNKKRPEPFRAQGEQKACPWFHLNSRLAAAHSVPVTAGAGGPFPARAPGCLPAPPSEDSHRPSSLCAPAGGVLFPVIAVCGIVCQDRPGVKAFLRVRRRFSVRIPDGPGEPD